MNQPLSNSDFTDLLDWVSLNETQTELSTEHFCQAARLSQSVCLSQQRWQVYINALAVLGFEQWLQERAPDLQLRIEQSSIWQPEYANLLAAACNILVGKFKVCIVTGSNLINEHSIPFAVFDIPRFTAHFYVLMQVVEEKEQVAISGFMSYEQYCRYQESVQLPIESNWTYTIPQSWFNLDANALLLNLRCLAANAIQLPVIENNQEINTITALKQKILKLESRFKNQYPWQLLTIQEGIDLLNNPELIKWVYKIIQPSPVPSLINVGYWLNNKFDNITQELGWMLMPSLRLSAMRSLENFEQIRTGLEQQGVHIPVTAKGAYRDLECNESTSLRLYAITWLLNETSANPEWVLLVALGSQAQAKMPETLKLEMRDETQVLFEQELKDTSQGILYAQVVGNYGERFRVNVTVDEETVIEIPPFGFELEESG
ncbi:MAG: DUF1822 family protein [Rivularia sp. (in: Bacteria)]|nr:DUF1822 family protein [Rivularia sp. MS3]